MLVRRHADPSAFLARAEPFLMASEAENNLLLSIADVPANDAYYATVEDGEEIVACALRTPPRKVILSRAAKPDAIPPLVDDLRARYPDLPAVMGPEPTVNEFAIMWAKSTGIPAREGMRQRLYEAKRVAPLERRPPGKFRIAEGRDVPRLSAWAESFVTEVNLLDHIEAERVTRRRVDAGTLFVWEDGEPVSMASWAGKTRHGVRVGFVYTPHEYRGRGYASACVADLTQRMLSSGCKFCCLVTDLANPTSNSIYQQIGYEPVCDLTDFVLDGGSGK